jgi:hypothetical protein
MNRYLILALCFGVLASGWIAIVCLAFHKRGYRRGREEGYEQGFEAGQIRTDNWWTGVEQEIYQTREKMREEERWP